MLKQCAVTNLTLVAHLLLVRRPDNAVQRIVIFSTFVKMPEKLENYTVRIRKLEKSLSSGQRYQIWQLIRWIH